MSNTEFYLVCAVLVALPILFVLRFVMAIWSTNRIMGTRIRNGPKSWLALAILRSEARDLMNRKP
jgi:hypothetical protein